MKDYILQKDFYELTTLINACLGKATIVDEEDKKYITKERKSLFEMAERLSDLLETSTLGINIPEFIEWTHPLNIRNKGLLEKFQVLEEMRFADYQRHIKEYKNIINELKEQLGLGRKIITDLYAEIEQCTKNPLWDQVVKLPWKLLPLNVDECFEEIIKHYGLLENKSPHIKYDIDRLYKVYKLNADQIFVGTDEFEGYIVFYFNNIKSAVLECPIHGNAIYVFFQHWEKLSRLSKASLLGNHKNNIVRIIHNGSWFDRLEWVINSRKNSYELINNLPLGALGSGLEI